jgi:hypothetical protein
MKYIDFEIHWTQPWFSFDLEENIMWLFSYNVLLLQMWYGNVLGNRNFVEKNWKRKLDEIDMFSQSSKIGNGDEFSFIAWKLKDKISSFSFKCKYAVLMELHKYFFKKSEIVRKMIH